jgi:hypothetical protein
VGIDVPADPPPFVIVVLVPLLPCPEPALLVPADPMLSLPPDALVSSVGSVPVLSATPVHAAQKRPSDDKMIQAFLRREKEAIYCRVNASFENRSQDPSLTTAYIDDAAHLRAERLRPGSK